MISSLTFGGGLEPAKIRLIANRTRKRIGGMRRRVLIFRKDFLSRKAMKIL
jgi:hypothetical protein